MTAAYTLYRRSRAYQDLSIEEQRHAVRTWAGTNGYRIVREFADDASGSPLAEGALKQLVRAIREDRDPKVRHRAIWAFLNADRGA